MVRVVAATDRSTAFPSIRGKRANAAPRSLFWPGDARRNGSRHSLSGSGGIVVRGVGPARRSPNFVRQCLVAARGRPLD